MSKVKIEKLNIHYDKLHVLKDIKMNVSQGEFVSILGKSGSGKTTLLNAIAGIVDVDSGDILFDDSSVTGLNMSKRNAVIVFQDYMLFPHMNIYDNIAYGLKVRKEQKQQIYDKVCEIAKVIGLEEKLSNYPNNLSGGEKQRVAIARALIVKPSVLLLDEPFSGLDYTTKQTMIEFILEITKMYNITTIMVTHDKNEAFYMSNQVAVMIDGEIVQYDSPTNIYNYPINKSVCNYLGNFNLLKSENASKLNIESNNTVAINYNDIKLNHTQDYEIVSKKFTGDKTLYQLSVDNFKLNVYSESDNYEVGQLVGFDINKYHCLSD